MTNPEFNRISVVIPVYQSGGWIGELVRAVSEVLQPWCRDHEIILVDDCSPDDTWQTIATLVQGSSNIKGIQLMYNEGQVKATLCGMRHASGEIIMTMDDDFQHPPPEMAKLLTCLHDHPQTDCVLGYFKEKHHSLYRNLGSHIIQRINAIGFRLPPGVRSSAFRALRRPVVDAILSYRSVNSPISALLFSVTQRVMSIPVEHAQRRSGRSHYTLAKQFRLALDNICNATMVPLRVVSVMGITTCVLSMLLAVFYAVKFAMGLIQSPGFITLVLLLTFFSGMILLSLGVIGEYIVRVLREVRQRPLYFIRESAGRFDDCPGSEHFHS